MKPKITYIVSLIAILMVSACEVDSVNTLFDEDQDLIFFSDALKYGPPVVDLFDGTKVTVGEQEKDNVIIEIGAVLTEAKSIQITTGGTAVLGEDYLIAEGLNLSFPKGTSVQTLTLSMINNVDFDDDSTIILSLPSGFGYSANNRRELLIDVVNDDVSSGTVVVAIDASSDDAEEGINGNSPGIVELDSSDLEFGEFESSTNGAQYVGLRYNNIGIPQGATIISASVSFMVDETVNDPHPVVMRVFGEAADNSMTFTNNDFDISGRDRTDAVVDWTIPVWTVVGETKNSADLKTVIQEIVDRAGWAYGNSLSLIFEPSDETLTNPSQSGRVTEAFEGDGGPILTIEWEL